NRLSAGERDLWLVEPDGEGLRRLTDLPGSSVEPQWSADGRYIAFIHSNLFESPDVWQVEVAGPPVDQDAEAEADTVSDVDPEPRPSTRSMPEAWTPAAQAGAEHVIFKNAGNVDVHAYLYRPPGARPGSAADGDPQTFPALIWLHGGPMHQMRYGWHPMIPYARFDAVNQWLQQQGYVVLALNYRGGIGYGQAYEQANHMAFLDIPLQDVIYGARYLKDLPFVDAGRVGVWGLSYGGYLALGAMAKHPGEFRVGVNVAGIWDLARTLHRAEGRFRGAAGYVTVKLGGEEHVSPHIWAPASPRNYVEQITGPLVNFHGTDDASVEFEQLNQLVGDLVAQGKEFEAHYYPGEAHIFKYRQTWRDFLPKLVRALDRHLQEEDISE
ncbi:MAG: prolyl oligopeptidase family serine peptidase, partial [Thermaerobacterales bacterium]